MTSETNIDRLFDAVKLGQRENAKMYAEKAQEEVERLMKLTQISELGKKALNYIKKLINNSLNGEIRSAQEYMKMEIMVNGYNGHLKAYLTGTYLKLDENPTNRAKNVQRGVSQDSEHKTSDLKREGEIGSDQNVNKNASAVLQNTDKNSMPNPNIPDTYQTNVGKRSEHIVRKTAPEKEQNSSEFADLKPTDIAVKFTNLYDKEWAAAFDYLYNNRHLKESRVIATLLKIVQDAFDFCTKESEKQIKAMYVSVCSLLKSGRTESQNNCETDTPLPKETDIVLLKEFRRMHGLLTISRLQNAFMDTFIKPICKKELNGIQPEDASEVVQYVKKAIKVTWMMTVLDPPVFMCPTSKEDFDPNMYSAFVKKGSQLDYFVWPALKVGRNGQILTTGKVHFK